MSYGKNDEITLIDDFFHSQLEKWELARNNYAALENARTKVFYMNDGSTVRAQFNPARIVSSGAKVDAQSISERPCFLCAANRPAEQESILFHDYEILVNPFPIFPKHFTIPAVEHTEQLIYDRFADMLDLAKVLYDYVIFYNGAKCGASAPDHAHFQAGSKTFLPVESDYGFETPTSYKKILLQSNSKESMVSKFRKLYGMLEIPEGDREPMMNILTWYRANEWIVAVFPRTKHRPDCYYAKDVDNLLISPASVDMGGVFITPQEKDYEKLCSTDIEKILQEVCMDEEKLLSITAKLNQI